MIDQNNILDLITDEVEKKLIFHFFEGVTGFDDRIDIGSMYPSLHGITLNFHVNWDYHSNVYLKYSEVEECIGEVV